MQMSLNTKQCASFFGGRLIRLELTPTISMLITSLTACKLYAVITYASKKAKQDIQGALSREGPPPCWQAWSPRPSSCRFKPQLCFGPTIKSPRLMPLWDPDSQFGQYMARSPGYGSFRH